MLPLTPISEGRSPIRHPGTRWVGDGRPGFENQSDPGFRIRVGFISLNLPYILYLEKVNNVL